MAHRITRLAPVWARRAAARGFTLVELLVVVAVIALLVAIILPALSETRRIAKQTICNGNLASFGTSTGSYAADNRDFLWNFSWRGRRFGPLKPNNPNPPNRHPSVPQFSDDDVQAAFDQLADILMRRANPLYPAVVNPGTIGIGGLRFVHQSYPHVVLADFLAARLPEPVSYCPNDETRKEWLRILESRRPWPADLDELAPFRASYRVSWGFWAPDQDSTAGRVRNAGNQAAVIFNGEPEMGNKRITDARFPSRKVMMHDEFSRHTGKVPLFFTHRRAIPTMAFLDGSVAARFSWDANRGGFVNVNKTIDRNNIITYGPGGGAAYPPWPDTSSPNNPGFFRFTVWGNKGVDYGTEPIR